MKGPSNLPDDTRGTFAHFASLGEGHAFPVLNIVAFIAPMHSMIEIIQASGFRPTCNARQGIIDGAAAASCVRSVSSP